MGLSFPTVKWIMICVTTAEVNYEMCDNLKLPLLLCSSMEQPLHSSHLQWGIKWGFPLSPLLFLLVKEGLCQEILEVKQLVFLKGVKIKFKKKALLTHLLFFNDILLFSNGLKRGARKFRSFSISIVLLWYGDECTKVIN